MHFLPALPDLAETLSETHELHHYGFRSKEPIPPDLKTHMRIHHLLFAVRRRSEFDKHFKAVLWMICLPFLGLYLRCKGFKTVFLDETVPLSVPFLRLGYRGRLVLTVHDFFMDIYFLPNRWLHPLGKCIKKIDFHAWRKVETIFTRVESTRDFLMEQGLDAARVQVVHDPCDLTLFRPRDPKSAREKWKFADEDVVLVHHGVMHPNKGNDRILRAMARMKMKLPRLKLLLIGEGPEYDNLRQLIHELALSDQVRLTGWLASMQEVAESLNAADIGLSMRVGGPGDHFHVTSTLVHNLASGLPTLSARLDGFQEVMNDGREGYFFDPECGEEFQDRLRELVENPALRKTMGKNARETAEMKFDRKRIAGQLAEGLRIKTC
ncbi:MAG: glycosyltransferase [Verrucomicrobia bacterium]|nr:glycosyltransferase [Verrucomicrobiota bacterium]MCH8513889.1 glycosyltransferase [Kiritimatiellia bacterium]